MNRFDIAPFALSNAPAGELKFEEMRDIESVEVDFAGPAPRTVGLQYMRKTWPQSRVERLLLHFFGFSKFSFFLLHPATPSAQCQQARCVP